MFVIRNKLELMVLLHGKDLFKVIDTGNEDVQFLTIALELEV